MNETLFQATTLIIPLVLAIVFHEVAHGWAALALGDPTAREQRRLSLNPLRHVDPIGTIVLPAMLALLKAPVFGWAKPVPVNKWRLANPRYGMMLVAAAGPVTNLVLAALGAVALGLMARGSTVPFPGAFTGGLGFAVANVNNFILINIFLALFNLLPVPPFDGSHLVEGVLPARAARAYDRLRPFGLPLLIMLLLVLPTIAPGLGIVENLVLPPVVWAADHYYQLAARVAA
jgi:Zn-dependent protease